MRSLQSAPRVASSIPLVVALALGGCGGASPDGDGGDGDSAQPSAAASAAASAAVSVAEPSSDTKGNGDAAGAEAVADQLAPPNATETSRTNSGGLVLLTFESPDSIDSLVSHYESAIPAAGLTIAGTITMSDGANFSIQGGNLSGSVTLVESSENPGGTAVAISVLDTSV